MTSPSRSSVSTSARHGAPPDIGPLVAFMRGRRVAILSGAGCSTESGIPDYRGPGATRRRPVQYREFMGDASVRARYWARSTVGWQRVSAADPNGAHRAIAELERRDRVAGVITQNVDGLHQRAGSGRVVELHGSLSRVRCTCCHQLEPRSGLQERLLAANPGYRDRNGAWAPDGDADLAESHLGAFRVPGCARCGGVLKPDVVFFGETVPKPRVARAWTIYEEADALLVVGSSLTVFSGYRFALRAAKERRPLAIVNVGRTRADAHAVVKIDGRAGTVLPALLGAACA